MPVSDDRGHDDERSGAINFVSPSRLWGRSVLAVIATVACLAFTSSPIRQDQPGSDKPQAASEPNRAVEPKQPRPAREVQGQAESPTILQDEREKQIVEDSARLLKLATDLKAEADKTTLDTLSLKIIREADEIEKLAQGVKKKIKEGKQTPK